MVAFAPGVPNATFNPFGGKAPRPGIAMHLDLEKGRPTWNRKKCRNRQLREPSWKICHASFWRFSSYDCYISSLGEQVQYILWVQQAVPREHSTQCSIAARHSVWHRSSYSTCWPTHLCSPSQGSADLDLTQDPWDADSSWRPRSGHPNTAKPDSFATGIGDW